VVSSLPTVNVARARPLGIAVERLF